MISSTLVHRGQRGRRGSRCSSGHLLVAEWAAGVAQQPGIDARRVELMVAGQASDGLTLLKGFLAHGAIVVGGQPLIEGDGVLLFFGGEFGVGSDVGSLRDGR